MATISNRPENVDVTSAHKKLTLGNALLLDVRSPGEYAGGHAAGAVNIPLQALDRRVGEIPLDRPVYVICQSGARSESAVTLLREIGYKNIINVLGGTSAWRQAGLPTERPAAAPGSKSLLGALSELFAKK